MILLEQDWSIKEVANRFGVHSSTILRTREKYNKNGTYDRISCSGRPSVLSSDLINFIKAENLRNSRTSLRKIQKIEKKIKKLI